MLNGASKQTKMHAPGRYPHFLDLLLIQRNTKLLKCAIKLRHTRLEE